jgi:hypothetical protein
VPTWLNPHLSRVTIVPHTSIFKNHTHLPTFNSNAIAANLANIPGEVHAQKRGMWLVGSGIALCSCSAFKHLVLRRGVVVSNNVQGYGNVMVDSTQRPACMLCSITLWVC